jgi:hypothetical protein
MTLRATSRHQSHPSPTASRGAYPNVPGEISADARDEPTPSTIRSRRSRASRRDRRPERTSHPSAIKAKHKEHKDRKENEGFDCFVTLPAVSRINHSRLLCPL